MPWMQFSSEQHEAKQSLQLVFLLTHAGNGNWKVLAIQHTSLCFSQPANQTCRGATGKARDTKKGFLTISYLLWRLNGKHTHTHTWMNAWILGKSKRVVRILHVEAEEDTRYCDEAIAELCKLLSWLGIIKWWLMTELQRHPATQKRPIITPTLFT